MPDLPARHESRALHAQPQRRPDRAVPGVAGGGRGHGTERPERHDVATTTPRGTPSARIVLLKGVDRRGFVFYTNKQSRKGEELAANRHAALLFHWKSLRRQVRIEGPIEDVTEAEADAYFATRAAHLAPGRARIATSPAPCPGATSSSAASPRRTRAIPASHMPRPPHWSGYRVLPELIEFWQDMPLPAARPPRLHPRRSERMLADHQALSLNAYAVTRFGPPGNVASAGRGRHRSHERIRKLLLPLNGTPPARQRLRPRSRSRAASTPTWPRCMSASIAATWPRWPARASPAPWSRR